MRRSEWRIWEQYRQARDIGCASFGQTPGFPIGHCLRTGESSGQNAAIPNVNGHGPSRQDDRIQAETVPNQAAGIVSLNLNGFSRTLSS
jgi:hypothetical protein